MSKQLIKILSICALVILCPLVIVGVSLMATEAVGCTLTIYDAGVEKLGDTDFGGKSSKVTIMVNGEAQESNTIKLTKRDEVTVTYEGVGYDFAGWYEGNYNEINLESDQAVSGEVSYTFEIEKNTVLTAVRNVKTYNVTYAGLYDDQTTNVDLQSETLEYNQPLSMLEAKAGGVQSGWFTSVDGVAGVTTTVANFANSGNVTVYPEWAGQMLIEYVKADGTVISSSRLFEGQVASYTLLDANNELVKANITAGYKFVGWTNFAGGEAVTSISYDVNGIKLVLNESLITYTLNVKYHALSEKVTPVTFDAVNGLGEYNPTRQNYTLKGLEYNDTVYTDLSKNGTLALAIFASAQTTIDLVAVWECNYDGIGINFKAIAYYEYEGRTSYYTVKGTKDGQEQNIRLMNQIALFEDVNEEGYFDVNDNVYQYFVGGFTNIQTLNGDGVSYQGQVNVSIDGTTDGWMLEYSSNEGTFADILAFLESSLGNGTLEGVTNITLEYIFA